MITGFGQPVWPLVMVVIIASGIGHIATAGIPLVMITRLATSVLVFVALGEGTAMKALFMTIVMLASVMLVAQSRRRQAIYSMGC